MVEGSYSLHQVRNDSDINLFWKWRDRRDRYMRENILPNSTFTPSTDKDYEWFFSKEYRETIMGAYHRKINPLSIVFLQSGGMNIGFAVYVIYHTEDGKCLIVGFNIDSPYRDRGIGTLFFNMLRKHVEAEKALYFALNLSNEENERFWKRNGFIKTSKDEYGNDVYEKHPL